VSAKSALRLTSHRMPESGNTLIAIHGGPGLSSHYMLNLERLAGPELAVVTYDQRGVGRSTSVLEVLAGSQHIKLGHSAA